MRHHILQATYPDTVRVAPSYPYLVLLRTGFTLPQTVTSCAVRSYRTLSPLPLTWRSSLCCTCRQLTLPRSYLASYPMEPGLSSQLKPKLGLRDCLANSTREHNRGRVACLVLLLYFAASSWGCHRLDVRVDSKGLRKATTQDTLRLRHIQGWRCYLICEDLSSHY